MTTYQESINDTVIRAYEDGFPLLMPRWGYVASAFVLFLIGFFGFFLNLMVILLMFKDRQLWTPLNMILFNLVCSDFSVSVLGNPFTLISALFHRWIFGKTMCVLYGFFMALLGITSITTLTVLSFERYLMVTRPLSSRHLSSKGAILSIVFIWSYSLALTTPPLFGWGNYVNEAANISCSVNWHEQSINTLTYILFLFAMGQIFPFAIISFSYINIIRTIKKNSQRMGRVGRAEAKVTSMVFVMIIAFTVAWTPYSVFALIEQFATEGIISPGAGVIPALVAKSSICYDPLIYIGMNTQFRQSIKRLFGIHSKGGLSQTEKGYDLMSPAHRFSRINDTTSRLNVSESNIPSVIKKQVVVKDKRSMIADEHCELRKNFDNPCFNSQNLSTIQENRTLSDAEKSEETMCDDNSGNDRKKLEVFGESCQLFNDNSPVLTIIDSERLVFSKTSLIRKREKEVDDSLENVYGNEAYEEHTTDIVTDDTLNKKYKATLTNRKKPHYCYSPNLLAVQTQTEKNKSVELSEKNTTFENNETSQELENFKSYLCRIRKNTDNDENYVV